MAGNDTVILTILNVFGTGEKMQAALLDPDVLDGCIYVSAEKQGPEDRTVMQHFQSQIIRMQHHAGNQHCQNRFHPESSGTGISQEYRQEIEYSI